MYVYKKDFMIRSIFYQLLLVGVIFLLPHTLFAQSGVVQGRVTDALTGDPLPGANVILEGTAFGAATDRDGEYYIPRVPTGDYTMFISYIGYENVRIPIGVKPNQTTMKDTQLNFKAILGKEVVVTAQLEGQMRAINQQLTSERIVNIVSSDRIKELPDQNAAESVGRLPGVAIQRSSGEGQKILVRGLEPKYSVITINNQRVPSTDDDDRSLDLSMISPDMLEGIELIKALTPDMEGDAIAGVVNFTVRRADPKFRSRLDLQGGYNKIRDNFRNYKANATVSNRFFDNKLGILATGSYQNVERPNDQFSGSYGVAGIDLESNEYILETSSLNLQHTQETRERYALSLSMDYKLSLDHFIQYNAFYSRLNSDRVNRQQKYGLGDNAVRYSINEREKNVDMWNNTLSGEHKLFTRMKMDWALSQSSTTNETPNSYGISFIEGGAFSGENLDTEKGLDYVQQAAKNNLDDTYLSGPSYDSSYVQEEHRAAQFNLKVPFTLTNQITGYHKTGFKYRRMYRDRVSYNMGMNKDPKKALSLELVDEYPDRYEMYIPQTRVKLGGFVDPVFDPGDFLNGRFDFPVGLKSGVAEWLFRNYFRHYRKRNESRLNDYEATEAVTAAYYMTQLNLWNRLMIVGGIRYEYTDNDYTGVYSKGGGEWSAPYQDTSAVSSYEDWLPMIQARYKLTSYLDVRVAATRTLVRPNYLLLVPKTRIGSASVNRGNPHLRHIKAQNYDLSFTYYSRRYGLLSVGGYYKALKDISYSVQRTETDPASEYYGLKISEPVNTEGITEVYGFEIDLQTNFMFLPSPLDGIVINANYTRIYGNSWFPVKGSEIGPPPYYATTFVTEERKGPIPGQSDHIINLSLGYEKDRFSGRVSMIYQSDILTSVGAQALDDKYQHSFVRWDATSSFRLVEGLLLYWSLNNFTSMAERKFEGRRNFPTYEQHYMWTTDTGLRYSF